MARFRVQHSFQVKKMGVTHLPTVITRLLWAHSFATVISIRTLAFWGSALMPLRDRLAARAARFWLSSLELPPGDIERQLQRSLGSYAASLVEGVSRRLVCSQLVADAAMLESFLCYSYTGDAILAIAMNSVFIGHGIEHQGRASLAQMHAGGIDPV